SLYVSFSCHASRAPSDLPSFPTRRSSDLGRHLLALDLLSGGLAFVGAFLVRFEAPSAAAGEFLFAYVFVLPFLLLVRVAFFMARSEEHTSELQSRGHLVCRLLLEKKKQKL